MKIGQIGLQFNVEQVDYYSNNTFLEHDMLLVDLDFICLMNGKVQASLINQIRSPNQISSNNLTPPIVERRRNDFADFVTHRNIPIISFLPQAGFRAQQYNGQLWHLNFLGQILGEDELNTKEENGSTIEVVLQTIFTNFLNKYKEHFSYKTVVTSTIGGVIAKNKFKGETLGYYNQNVIFLPRLNPSIASHQDEFLQDLYEVAKKVRQPAIAEELPPWAAHYYVPGEQQLVRDRNAIEAQIVILQEESHQKAQAIQAKEMIKMLFTATGTPLEQAVIKLFQELGVEAQEGEKGRADLILKYKEQPGVAEVKGVTKTASEGQASQLEKWVSFYFEDYQVQPKAFLIVNTFQQTELKDRDAVAFPHQMLRFSKGRDHCLITTTQLLGLYFECQAHPEKKDELIQSLFDKSGVYEGFQDWNTFITHEEDSRSLEG